MSKGLTIIYYGNGKGKTTAAMGMAVRAVGTGFRVLVLQFIKGEWPSGERDFLKSFSELDTWSTTLGTIKIKTLGRGFVKILGDQKPFTVHQEAARKGVEEAIKALQSKNYDLIILDELLSAYEEKLINLSDVEKVISKKPKNIHLVITGHRLPPRLKKKVDLITEMKMIKHPYYSGVLAQRGIDY